MDKARASDTPWTQKPAGAGQLPDLDLTGKTLGDFKVRRRLGQGGMGQVYLAEQISLKREVALKTLRRDLSANRVSLERFDAEAKAVAKATHANIVQIYVIDKAQVDDETVHYLALEYVDGRNLRELLEKKGSPDLLMGLSIMQQVASALQRASELGIIHRDIKPENIQLTRQGEVKVADFGLSRCFTDAARAHNLTQTGVTMGTPLYMAPEQVELKNIDPRTDIYSFGVTCYHMFAGHPPFKGNSPFEIAVQHVQKEPPPLHDIRPDLPAELSDLIHRMMRKKPEERPQTSREIVREISRIRDGVVGGSGTNFAVDYAAGSGRWPGGMPATLTTPAGAAETAPEPTLTMGPTRRALRYRPLWIAAALSVVLAFVLGLGASYLLWGAAGRPLDGDDRAGKAADDREQELIKLKDQHSPPKAAEDLKHTLNLGLFYLHEGRLDRADDLYRGITGVKEYGDVGKLGSAMVLAFRADPAPSNQLFQQVLKDDPDKSTDETRKFWKNYPPWRKMIGAALFHNKVNRPAEFPKDLERWLRAPAPLARKTVKRP